MDHKQKKCIIIPAYNEEDTIGGIVKNIKKITSADIIVIDDASEDCTAEKARHAGALIISHPFNMGYGTALQTGYKYAVRNRYDFLLQMDGDGQHDPRYIPELFRQIETKECDFLMGSRFLGGNKYKAGIFKSFGIRIFRLIIRIITGETVTDPTSGYQCLSRKVFAIFTRDIFPCDYPDANVIILLYRMGFKIREVPVDMVPNPSGRSMHQGGATLMYYFFKMFLSIFIIMLREKSFYSSKRAFK